MLRIKRFRNFQSFASKMVKANIATLASRKAYSKVIHSIERGTDVNTVDKHNRNALHYATARRSILSNIKYLVEKGINVNLKDVHGKTPLMYACEDFHKDYETVKFLIESGANIHDKNNNGETPLLTACNKYEIVKLLIEHGANVNLKDKYGHTVLDCYMTELSYIKKYYKKIEDIEKYTNIVKYLISKGADINLLSKEYRHYPNNFLGTVEVTSITEIKKEAMKYYEEVMIEKSKERSDLLKEELIAKYHSPENIEKWSVYYNKPFDEVLEVM